MTGLVSTLATIWRLAIPYFRAEDRKAGRLLLIALIATELSIVAINVLLNQWNNRFYNALQDRSWDAFVSELTIFAGLAGAYILLAVYQIYLNQWLQIRWRQWMTKSYLETWLSGPNHYRMQLLGDAADNPDQRISEDVRIFTSETLDLGLGLLNSLVTLVSFTAILWRLSGSLDFDIGGYTISIPGYMFWAAGVYSGIGSLLAPELHGGDSIAVNGVCLTVILAEQDQFHADVGPETVRVTTLGRLARGCALNLERPLRADSRFGGHFVQGHVDATTALVSRRAEGEGARLRFALPTTLARYVVEKGFITLDGVSLTVAALAKTTFEVALIPHSAKRTTLGSLRERDVVNVEVDIIGKYIERILDARGA